MNRFILLLSLSVHLILLVATTTSSDTTADSTDLVMGSASRCEPLDTDTLYMCKDIGYNETRFPNFMKQKSQREAAADMALFLPLIKVKCSSVLKLFLCSLYAPPCVKNYSSTLKPCREMCEKVKTGCLDFMKSFSLNWPEYIDCYQFPTYNSPEACVSDDNYGFSNGQSQLQQQQQQQQSHDNFGGLLRPIVQSNQFASQFNNQQQQQQLNGIDPTLFINNLNPQQKQVLLNSLTQQNTAVSNSPLDPNRDIYKLYAAAAAAAAAAASVRVKFVCPPALQIVDTKNTYYLNVNGELINNCAMPCDNTVYEANEIAFTRSWIFVWSIIGFVATVFTLLTYMIETARFRYPERPIILLSACYMFVSLAYLIGSSSSTNNSVVCRPQKNGLMETKDYLVQGVEHIPCTLLFMMIYFFGMASALWWIVLTITWFLAAGLKWSHEAIEEISSYFHLAAWGIPGIKLIAILWLQKIDADMLSGVCYTGLRNVNLLRGFVLIPLIVYLIVGCFFLFAGFFSLFRIRKVMRNDGQKTKKLERFMVRIGMFSVLYIVPTIIVISCYFYEQKSSTKWIDYWLKRNFIAFNLPPDYVTSSLHENDRSSMVFSLFIVKYSMILIVGITSSFWIWSHKTIKSWRRFFEKLGKIFSYLKPKYKNEAAV